MKTDEDGRPEIEIFEGWNEVIQKCIKLKETHYQDANGPRLYREIELALLSLNITKVKIAITKYHNGTKRKIKA